MLDLAILVAFPLEPLRNDSYCMPALEAWYSYRCEEGASNVEACTCKGVSVVHNDIIQMSLILRECCDWHLMRQAMAVRMKGG